MLFLHTFELACNKSVCLWKENILGQQIFSLELGLLQSNVNN